MELTSDQSRGIKAFIQEWSKNTKFELETSFGVGGVVDSNTFLQVAQRLRSKGFAKQGDRSGGAHQCGFGPGGGFVVLGRVVFNGGLVTVDANLLHFPIDCLCLYYRWCV